MLILLAEAADAVSPGSTILGLQTLRTQLSLRHAVARGADRTIAAAGTIGVRPTASAAQRVDALQTRRAVGADAALRCLVEVRLADVVITEVCRARAVRVALTVLMAGAVDARFAAAAIGIVDALTIGLRVGHAVVGLANIARSAGGARRASRLAEAVEATPAAALGVELAQIARRWIARDASTALAALTRRAVGVRCALRHVDARTVLAALAACAVIVDLAVRLPRYANTARRITDEVGVDRGALRIAGAL